MDVLRVKKKARRLELLPTKEKGFSSDILRGGRMGEDYAADAELLRLNVYNRNRLVKLLDEAMFEHRWADASGIVSVLLRSVSWLTISQFDTRPLFTTAMQVLKELEKTEPDSIHYKRLFQAMYNRQTALGVDSKRRQVEAEFRHALHLYNSGDYEAAYSLLRPVIDGPHLRNEPSANLVYGLITHRMWYNRVSEHSSSSSDSVGECEPEMESDVRIDITREEDQKLLALRYGEDISEDFALSSADDSVLKRDVTNRRKKLRKRKRREDHEGDAFWANAVVKVRPVMDRRLFPVQVQNQPDAEYRVPLDPRSKELFDKAIEHLRRAVACKPETIAACVPLVQLLLSTGDVEGAVKEIDICYQATKHILPLSLKALLLESLNERDGKRIASCYEEILLRNPSSVDAVTGLVGLYDTGEYDTKSLLEALASHLDVESASLIAWRKLADCFLEIATCVKQNGQCDVSAQELASIFLERSRLWSIKYFPHDKRSTDETAQWWKLTTYKAACAAHLFGPDYAYVERASYALSQLKKLHSSSVLESHRQQSLNLFTV